MSHQQQQFDVPDFLHNSPYIPLSTTDESSAYHHVAAKPTLSQILRSRRVRNTAIFLLSITAFLLIRSIINNTIKYFDGPRCLHSTPIDPPTAWKADEDIDWSKYAYVQYATNTEYLCNSVMMFQSLQEVGSRAERLLMYSSRFSEDGDNVEGMLLSKAKEKYGVKLVSVEIQHNKEAFYRWADSYTKLLAFNQTQYNRLLHLDSDCLLLRPMDELFFIPSTPVALPRAYWLAQPGLASHIMLLTPSHTTFSLISQSISTSARFGIYDMEIINLLFGGKCRLLPHKKYSLLTGEFRREGHRNWLSDKGDGEKVDGRKWRKQSDEGKWDAEEAVRGASWVHFSDSPLGKPWEEDRIGRWERLKPSCGGGKKGEEDGDCRERRIWVGFYEEFWDRRERVCNFEKG